MFNVRSQLATILLVLLPLTLPACASEFAILRNGFSVRHDHRELRNGTTRLYFDSGNDSFVDVPTAEIVGFEPAPFEPPSARPSATSKSMNLEEAVSAASERNQIDPDLITSVIHAESGFNSRAVSTKGARGLMQLMPNTATQLGVSNAFDPASNVDGGTRYLRQLLLFYNDDMAKALAAYNAGPQRVARYNGIPPYHETHVYVARVIREFNRKKTVEMQKAKSRPQTAAEGSSAPELKRSAREAKKVHLKQSAMVGAGPTAVHQ